VNLLAQAAVVVERELAKELLTPVFGLAGDPRKPHLEVCQQRFSISSKGRERSR
jgi:hypothetical protein